MKTKWKDTPITYKIATICSIVVNIAVVILAFLQIFDVWSSAADVYMPLLSVSMLLQAYMQWKTNRSAAYFSIFAAVFIIICTIYALL